MSTRASKRKSTGKGGRGSKKSKEETDDDATTDYFNAGSYGFGSTDRSGNQDDDEAPLSWRLDEGDSLSDWKIVVTRASGGGSGGRKSNKKAPPATATYHVHKNILAVGPKRSEYFASLFKSRNQVPELANATSEIELEDSAADAFPVMLDFIYNARDDSIDDVSTNNAVALRYLAQYFQIRSLFMKVTKFVEKDLRPENSPTYILEATTYHDVKLANAAIDICAAEYVSIDVKHFEKLPPALLVKIFSSDNLDNGGSLHLSKIVAHYCETHVDDDDEKIDEAVFVSLTDEKIMPHIDNKAALPLLRSLTAISFDDSSTKVKASAKKAKKRCIDALSVSWTDIATVKTSRKPSGRGRPRGGGNKKGTSADGSDLPSDLQVEFLGACLGAAKSDMEKSVREKERLIEDIADLRNQKQALANELAKFNRVPNNHDFVTVNAGYASVINKSRSTYHHNDYSGTFGRNPPTAMPTKTSDRIYPHRQNGYIFQDSSGRRWPVYYYHNT
mmetsp:Transcript_15953/g.34677  ORF Transcript_15953/g.34677 Transcript_15953/m.34677 type:complete len:503 (-) Transcript_15953:223-1731(-)